MRNFIITFCLLLGIVCTSCKQNPKTIDIAPQSLTYTSNKIKVSDLYFNFSGKVKDPLLNEIVKVEKRKKEEAKQRGEEFKTSFKKEDENEFNNLKILFSEVMNKKTSYLIMTPENPSVDDMQRIEAYKSIYGTGDDGIFDMTFTSPDICEAALYRIGNVSLLDTKLEYEGDGYFKEKTFQVSFEFIFTNLSLVE